jgi:hypothetical protein
MVNARNVIMSFFVIMMAIYLCLGCSSSERPSDEVMKNIIVLIEGIDNAKLVNLKFDTFNITNSFLSKNKGSGGETTPFNIEVNYKIIYTLLINNTLKEKQEIIAYNKQVIDRLEKDLNYYNSKKLTTQDFMYIQDIKNEIEIWKKCLEDNINLIEENKEIIQNNVKLTFNKKGNK